MIDWLTQNWYYVVFFILVVIICIYGVMNGKVKEWMKWAVTEAEAYLGSGTGQLKLREVYNMFMAKFPVFSKIVPFDIFSKWVDLALDWMRVQLENNPNFAEYINGDNTENGN